MDRLRLGYVADPLPGHEMFRGFMAIPYLRRSQGNDWSVVSMRYRCIRDHECKGHGKYMSEAGDRSWLYNTVALLKRSPIIAITEGEIDAMTAQACGIPSVGVPGTQTWQPYFRELFLGYRDVFIFADGDQPGIDFANDIAKSLPNSKILPCPTGEDVNSLVNKQGPQALLGKLKQ